MEKTSIIYGVTSEIINGIRTSLNSAKELLGSGNLKTTEEIKDATEVVQLVLNAYNRWQADERNYADYIYSFAKINDIVEIAKSYSQGADFIGLMGDVICNHDRENTYMLMRNECREEDVLFEIDKVIDYLYNMADEIAPFIVKYVGRCEEYAEIWEKYITLPLEIWGD